MLERVRDWVRDWLAGPVQEPPMAEGFVRRYEDADEENITATIANKLAALVMADSSVEVSGDGRRAAMVREAVQQLWNDGGSIVAQALGKGGKLIVPVVRPNGVEVQAIDQSRMAIHEMQGSRLVSATVLCDVRAVGRRQYYLLADYSMEDGVQWIRYRACNDDGENQPLNAVDDWAGITKEISIGNTDRLLIAFLRCPRDNRTDRRGHGVPITYGAEQDVAELVEHIRVYRREFRLSRMMLGLDSGLWRNPVDGTAMAADITAMRKTVQDSDDPFIPWDAPSLEGRSAWQVYAPPIRYEAMEARYNSLCRRIEKACGLSQGVLTERQRISYANKDEIRAAMYDTFCVVRAMRGEWERALRDAAYAVDVLAERFDLSPAGEMGSWQLNFDWDYGLVESTEQTFDQYMKLYEIGAMSDAELRQWAKNGTLQEARETIAAIERERSAGSKRAAPDEQSATAPENRGVVKNAAVPPENTGKDLGCAPGDNREAAQGAPEEKIPQGEEPVSADVAKEGLDDPR